MLNKIIELGISKTEALELISVSKDIDSDYELLKQKYPIQYLIGYVNFYGNKILVNKNVLIPRYETELLVEKTINYSKKFFNLPKIVDVGTGSGAISIALMKEINCTIDAVDISDDAISLAKQNALLNKTNINIYKSDLLNNCSKYDIIISNPPYISHNEKIMESVYDYEPHIALFAEDDGLEMYKRIIDDAKTHLNEKFMIAFEIGYKQSKQISAYAQSKIRNIKVYTEKDYSNKDRFIFIISE